MRKHKFKYFYYTENSTLNDSLSDIKIQTIIKFGTSKSINTYLKAKKSLHTTRILKLNIDFTAKFYMVIVFSLHYTMFFQDVYSFGFYPILGIISNLFICKISQRVFSVILRAWSFCKLVAYKGRGKKVKYL